MILIISQGVKMALTNEHKAFIERIGRLAAADMQKSGVLASLYNRLIAGKAGQ